MQDNRLTREEERYSERLAILKEELGEVSLGKFKTKEFTAVMKLFGNTAERNPLSEEEVVLLEERARWIAMEGGHRRSKVRPI